MKQKLEAVELSVGNARLEVSACSDILDLLDEALTGCEKVAASIPKPKDKL